jgi:hypothetical protein
MLASDCFNKVSDWKSCAVEIGRERVEVHQKVEGGGRTALANGSCLHLLAAPASERHFPARQNILSRRSSIDKIDLDTYTIPHMMHWAALTIDEGFDPIVYRFRIA